MSKSKALEQTWDASYPDDDNERLWPEDVVPVFDFARRFFVANSAILDLPCGDGKNVEALAELGPVVAADSSERALHICETRRREQNLTNVVTMQADAFQTPFSDGTFDNVFCCDLLGHLPDAGEAMREIRRITSPGGTAVVTVFTERDSVLQDERMRKNEDGSYWFRDKWFFRFYTEAAARALATRSGFKVVDIEELTWWEPPHPGYREYRHQHSSWALALRRTE